MTKDRFAELVTTCQLAGVRHILVGGYVTDEEGRVLVLRRAEHEFKANLFELPSGAVEPGESLPEALSREVLEETGLVVVHTGAYMGGFDYHNEQGQLSRQLNFVVDVLGTTPVRLSAEHREWTWVSRREADSPRFDPPMRRQLRQYFGAGDAGAAP